MEPKGVEREQGVNMFKIHGIKFSKNLVKILIKICNLDNLIFVSPPPTTGAGAVPDCCLPVDPVTLVWPQEERMCLVLQ